MWFINQFNIIFCRFRASVSSTPPWGAVENSEAVNHRLWIFLCLRGNLQSPLPGSKLAARLMDAIPEFQNSLQVPLGSGSLLELSEKNHRALYLTYSESTICKKNILIRPFYTTTIIHCIHTIQYLFYDCPLGSLFQCPVIFFREH